MLGTPLPLPGLCLWHVVILGTEGSKFIMGHKRVYLVCGAGVDFFFLWSSMDTW